MPETPDISRLSRRQLLRLGAGALLAAACPWPGTLWAGEPDTKAFNFFAINDLHFTDANCAPFFERLVKQLKATPGAYDFCLIVGDLSENGKAEQVNPVRDIFKTLGMPVYTVVGNHDHLTDTDRKAYEQAYPDSINYTFEHKGWQFIGLDTSEGRKALTTAPKATLDYVDAMLPKLDKSRPIVLFTHFPLGPITPNRVKNADDLLDRFKDYNLRAVLNGHYHGFTQRTRGEVVLTTDRCCSFRAKNHDGTPEKGYFTCKVEDGKVAHTFVEMAVGEKG